MKKLKSPSKSLDLIACFALLLTTPLLLHENPARATVVIALLLIWVLIGRLIKNRAHASLLFLIVLLPLNITIAFPQLTQPYVAGVYVNYLVPMVSILDIAVALLFLGLFEKWNKPRSLPVPIYILGAYLALHILFHAQLSVAIGAGRIFLYTVTAWLLTRKAKDIPKQQILWALIGTVIGQGALGLTQFALGRSLGLQFLGESRLLSGTVSSSLVSLCSGELRRS